MENEPLEKVLAWRVNEVVAFLKEFLGTEEYGLAIKAAQITGRVLVHMPLKAWLEIGVSRSGHRHAILGWVQEKMQEKENLKSKKCLTFDEEKKTSVESCGGSTSLEAMQEEKCTEVEEDYQKVFSRFKERRNKAAGGRSYLKDISEGQLGAYNRNLRRIRHWLDDGVAGLTKEEFASVDLKTNSFMKAKVMDLIREKKDELEPFFFRKEPRAWDDKDIYDKLKGFKHYISNTCSKNQEKGSISDILMTKSSIPKIKVQPNLQGKTATLPTISAGAISASEGDDEDVTRDQVYAQVIGSFYYIPEDVIIFRSSMQKNIGKVEFSFKSGMDEGTRPIAIGLFRGYGNICPYETWNVELLEVILGKGMSKLFVPGTRRLANTLSVGEVICVPAIFARTITEFAEDSCPMSDGRSKHGSVSIGYKVSNNGSNGKEQVQGGSIVSIDKLPVEIININEDTQATYNITMQNSTPMQGSNHVLEMLAYDDCYHVDVDFENQQDENLSINKRNEDVHQSANGSSTCSTMFDDTEDITPILEFVAKNTYGEKKDSSVKEISLKSIGSSANAIKTPQCPASKVQVETHTYGDNGMPQAALKVVSSSSSLAQSISHVQHLQSIMMPKSPRRVKKAKFASLSSMMVLGDITNKCMDNVSDNSTQVGAGLNEKEEGKIVTTLGKEVMSSRKSKRFRKVPARYKEEEQIRVQDLKVEEQEAIAMKMLGENDVDVMYGNLECHLKKMKKKFKLNINLATLETGKNMLHFLVEWALKSNKIELKNENGTPLTQDCVTLL